MYKSAEETRLPIDIDAHPLVQAAVAQREVGIEPDAMMEDRTGEAVVLVALRVSGWRHVGCLS
jgi:hypothetical protein